MRRIIVIAYQLHYSKGSEYAVAWSYINHMNQNNQLTVLYGTSGEYHQIGETSEMEEYCACHKIKNVDFIPVRPTFKPQYYNYSLKGQILFYREYKRWHEDVKETIQGLLEHKHYDIIHFLGPIGYREPGYVYDFPLPYIWGPIGGFGGVNIKLLKATCSITSGLKMLLRRILNTIQTHTSKRTRKALRNSDVIICATSQYQKIVCKLLGRSHHSLVEYQPENCINELYDLNVSKFSGLIHISFIGRIDDNKGLIFVLEALKVLGHKNKIVLDVIGEDRLNGKMHEWAKNNNIDDMIRWHGKVNRTEVFNLLNNSQLMVLTSLYEANTTVVWESLAMGVPILALDHCGMHDIIDEKIGFKILIKSYTQIVKDIERTFQIILDNPTLLKHKANEVLVERDKYTWRQRCAFFERMYSLAEDNFKRRQCPPV